MLYDLTISAPRQHSLRVLRAPHAERAQSLYEEHKALTYRAPTPLLPRHVSESSHRQPRGPTPQYRRGSSTCSRWTTAVGRGGQRQKVSASRDIPPARARLGRMGRMSEVYDWWPAFPGLFHPDAVYDRRGWRPRGRKHLRTAAGAWCSPAARALREEAVPARRRDSGGDQPCEARQGEAVTTESVESMPGDPAARRFTDSSLRGDGDRGKAVEAPSCGSHEGLRHRHPARVRRSSTAYQRGYI